MLLKQFYNKLKSGKPIAKIVKPSIHDKRFKTKSNKLAAKKQLQNQIEDTSLNKSHTNIPFKRKGYNLSLTFQTIQGSLSSLIYAP